MDTIEGRGIIGGDGEKPPGRGSARGAKGGLVNAGEWDIVVKSNGWETWGRGGELFCGMIRDVQIQEHCMNLSLSEDAEQFIDEQVKAGRFPSREAVVQAARAELRESAAMELDNEAIAAIQEAEADSTENHPAF
ncbi:MAG TPA: hypothetical protein VHM90_04735 [Phycisphaerae bacterium]|nr:hypothetical protein [Phycisphaerae bacterium]